MQLDTEEHAFKINIENIKKHDNFLTIEQDGIIKILHLDTGMTLNKTGDGGNKNLLQWGVYVMDNLVARSNQSSTYIAQQWLGEKNVFNASPNVTHGYAMDKVKYIDEIINIWDEYYKSMKPELLKFINTI